MFRKPKKMWVGTFRAETTSWDELHKLYRYLRDNGWETKPPKDTDTALYGAFTVWTAKDATSAENRAAFVLRRTLKKAEVLDSIRSLTLKVTIWEGDDTADLDPDEIDNKLPKGL